MNFGELRASGSVRGDTDDWGAGRITTKSKELNFDVRDYDSSCRVFRSMGAFN